MKQHANDQPLDVTLDGTTEILRVYRAELIRCDLTAGDGITSVRIPVEVPLRYSHEQAAELDATSLKAQTEAFVRAVKLEQRSDPHLSRDVIECGEVALLRQKLVPARKAR